VIAGIFSHQVVAPQWNQLLGKLSDDEESITWSDGSYWTRCRTRANLQGTWYLNGNAAQPCRIEQTDGSLRVRNDAGQPGSGHLRAATPSPSSITASFSAARCRPTAIASTPDNGTSWVR